MSSHYNFTQIAPIPDAMALVDIVLSRTNKKTPTEIHHQFKITRIRKFYMRKVKFTQTTINEKLSAIVDGFPKLDDIHPFYADQMNVLYDKDHYKLALGHINKARNIVDNVANDYVRMLKYADSLYRCKMMKRAALGRMATLLKKLKASLAYLEEVRKHMSRLPQISTSTRTMIITGYPNVGKSSFMNKITNANVDVQNYPFTTQSLFVGHTNFQYTDWQVIDTPGLLDRPISERNTIEMQAITALAHLNACVIFFIDISEICGYSIEAQVALFESIKVLFQNKPLVVVLNKVDVQPFEELEPEVQKRLQDLAKDNNACLIHSSNITETGIADVKKTACEILLDHRLTQKAKDPKKAESVLNRVHVAQPKMDRVSRPPIIPDSVKAKLERPEGKTMREIQDDNGGAGVWAYPYQEHYQLEDPDWKYDKPPDFFHGKNVADFYDPDIEEKLNEIEKEEEYLVSLEQDEIEVSDEDDAKLIKAYKGVQSKIQFKKDEHVFRKQNSNWSKNIEADDLVNHLEGKEGVNTDQILANRVKKRKTLAELMGVSKKRQKTGEMMEVDKDASMNDNQDTRELLRQKKRNFALGRMSGSDPKNHSLKVQNEAHERVKKKIERRLKRTTQATDSDRHVVDALPKWLNSGKRGNGKTDRR